MKTTEKNYLERLCREIIFNASSIFEGRKIAATTGQDKEKFAKMMFEKLKKHVGEEVTYTGWLYGVKQSETAVLKNVTDFQDVEIGDAVMQFVGYGSAISNIISKDGEILYHNPFIESEYDRRRIDDVMEAKRLIFGDRVVDVEVQNINFDDYISRR